MQFQIDSMACDGCVRGVTAAIRQVDPAATVAADLATRQVQVTSASPREVLARALADAGFASD
jgi:copper chaperone